MNRPACEAALLNEASTPARVDALSALSTTPHRTAGPARLTALTVANRPQTEVHSLGPATAHRERVVHERIVIGGLMEDDLAAIAAIQDVIPRVGD